MIRLAVLLFLVFAITTSSTAQQFVVMKKGHIMTRYNLGDEIRFVLKGDDPQVYHAAILSIREFEFITLQKDTIRYNQIAKLKFKNPKFNQYAKSTLIGSASLMALHFALKEPFGDKNPQAVKGLAYVAGAGLVPIVFGALFNKRQIKIKGFKHLKFINYDSPLYN